MVKSTSRNASGGAARSSSVQRTVPWLAEEPVGGAAVTGVGLGKVEAGNVNPAVRRPPDVEFGPVDHQLFEAEVPQRPRRESRDHARQPQRLASVRIEQDHVRQLERRDRPVTVRGHAADPDRHAEHSRDLDFQVGAKLSDSGHNPAMQRSPQEGQHQPGGGEKPQDPLREAGGRLQQT
jgi:hypothetical protein